jgi:hypothetical protein
MTASATSIVATTTAVVSAVAALQLVTNTVGGSSTPVPLTLALVGLVATGIAVLTVLARDAVRERMALRRLLREHGVARSAAATR